MAAGLKRKSPESELLSLCCQDRERYSRLHHSLLLTSLSKYTTAGMWHMQSSDYLRRRVLLKNTIQYLRGTDAQPSSQGSCEKASPRMPSGQERGVLSLLEPNNGEGQWPSASSIFPSPYQEEAAKGDLPELLPDPFLSTASELLPGEGLQKSDGHDPRGSIADPVDEPSDSPSEVAAANPAQESSLWDALSHEAVPCDSWLSTSLFGSLEILSSSYLSALPVDDPFLDIDTSGMESLLGTLPSDGQPPLIEGDRNARVGPQLEALLLPSQNARGMGEPDRAWEILVGS